MNGPYTIIEEGASFCVTGPTITNGHCYPYIEAAKNHCLELNNAYMAGQLDVWQEASAVVRGESDE